MKKTFSVSFLKDNSGCYKKEGKLKKAFEDNGKTCFEEPSCDITLDEVMKSNIPDQDKYWFLSNNVMSKEENKELGLILLDLLKG